MDNIKVLVTMPMHSVFHTFFNQELVQELEQFADVSWNTSPTEQFTKEELCEKIRDVDIIVTGWGTLPLDEEVLRHADKLRMVAHTGGSVNPYVTDAVYERGIRVVSGNNLFAESVAEGVIAYALASLRDIPKYSQDLKQGIWPSSYYNKGLLDKRIGIVGYGMISRYTVEMLKPFRPRIKVYSRHISQEELDRHQMTRADLEDIFSTCDIVSIHAARTPDTHHMITEELLNRMPEGSLLINTARGAIIDEEAMCRVLANRPIYAVLDVFEAEPLPSNHPLTKLDNVILMPHMGGPTVDRRFMVTKQVIGDMKRFLNGEPLICEISQAYANQMTR
ncbi:hydroxyacid dehydrogenase [Cohnella lubricantis]|uniref:Hydroxyacid dehydrogenase n=1 Tax=Cohnella lubricantis TaxID=2163172 RepID=A0A841T4W7_9BACL|nr:hydroxyacid dehydrogenase [Cohnella lubricantis]MBB6675892.1 hydroxyacid dehydrogenase [Cohnella lubricantis]MBP2117191.1 phosphoglycerate dehydrogenase-like enzyme [Cohnella lubricantis]